MKKALLCALLLAGTVAPVYGMSYVRKVFAKQQPKPQPVSPLKMAVAKALSLAGAAYTTFPVTSTMLTAAALITLGYKGYNWLQQVTFEPVDLPVPVYRALREAIEQDTQLLQNKFNGTFAAAPVENAQALALKKYLLDHKDIQRSIRNYLTNYNIYFKDAYNADLPGQNRVITEDMRKKAAQAWQDFKSTAKDILEFINEDTLKR